MDIELKKIQYMLMKCDLSQCKPGNIFYLEHTLQLFVSITMFLEMGSTGLNSKNKAEIKGEFIVSALLNLIQQSEECKNKLKPK